MFVPPWGALATGIAGLSSSPEAAAAGRWECLDPPGSLGMPGSTWIIGNAWIHLGHSNHIPAEGLG